MEKEPLLRMEAISKHFPGVQALDNVDFEVYHGEILGFVGENGAGKSTLVKIISGLYAKDHGEIWFQGEQVELHSPKDAQQLGISTIHQELALVPHLSVAENIFLNRAPILAKPIGMVDFALMNRQAGEILAELGVDIPVHQRITELPVAAQQMVEIAKAFSLNPSLILMDEPTSALSGKEVDALFAVIQRLKAKGVSVVFISHRLEEVVRQVDRVLVMRDGHRVGSLPIAEATEEKIIRLMVGREVGLFPKEDAIIGDPVLEVRGISGDNGVRNVSFAVRKGEILGLAGLMGAGRTEVARLVCGVDRLTDGAVFIEGKRTKISSPTDAVRRGIGWVPEDRKRHGLILGMSVRENVTLAILRRISGFLGKISGRKENEISERYVEALSVMTPSLTQTVRNLSGGNQQKVVLAKWLASEPKVMIMDEPTRGIDVGAKSEVHALMSRLAQQGMGIVMISSEMPEIVGMSDRVIVMCQGRVTGEYNRSEIDQEDIMTCATQFLAIDAIEQSDSLSTPVATD